MKGRWDWSLGRILHFDAESTGLVRPRQPLPLLLEVAVILTDAELRVLDRYEAVIHHEKDALDALDPHPIVVEMHEKSGLWKALREPGTVPVAEAEAAMIGMLDRHPDPEGRPVVWAGFSPGALDRPLVGALMPTLYGRLHHRTIDVSALKLVLKNYAGLQLEESDALHRAMADAQEELDVLRTFRSYLGQGLGVEGHDLLERAQVGAA